jgi:excisionase family DNA binding protein
LFVHSVTPSSLPSSAGSRSYIRKVRANSHGIESRGNFWRASSLKRKGLASEVYCGGDMQIEEILTANQVAELLQIHPRTVYKLVKEGSLPGRKFGGGWRFSKSEILAMVQPKTGSHPVQARS